MAGDTAVVVCSYDGDDPELTLRCLRAAAAQGPVVLVDMSTERERIAVPAAELADVHHVSESSGLGESRRRGLEATAARYVAFLDSDAIPREGWLAALSRAIEPADVAVAGGPVLPVWPAARRPPSLFRTATAGDFLSMLDLGTEPLDTPRVLPGNMIVDRELTGERVFGEGRGRRPDTLVGAEEIEMMVRVRAEGRRIVYAPAAAVDHATRPERMSWRWMWRRLEAAGQESVENRARLDPLPRRLTVEDRAFLAVGAPAFLIGRAKARRASRRGPAAPR